MFTTIVMILVIVWAIRQICKEIGLTDFARNKIKSKCKAESDS